METLTIILLIAFGIILTIGMIRVLISPYNGFWNLVMEMVFIDLFVNAIIFVCECLAEAFND